MNRNLYKSLAGNPLQMLGGLQSVGHFKILPQGVELSDSYVHTGPRTASPTALEVSCEYCTSLHRENRCPSCGAPWKVKKAKPHTGRKLSFWEDFNTGFYRAGESP
jgi:hypothetical protein